MIRFTFDFLSPYAYLAWTQIHALAERHGVGVEPVPVLFAGLLNHYGQKGPAEIPAKRIWVWKDTLRRGLVLGVPFAPPPTHPFNPLLALRAVIAAPDERKRALIDALFAATWGEAEPRGVEHAETVRAAASRTGLDPDALLARTQDPAVKATLRDNTDRAIAAGVFGVPTMTVGDEAFWGLDSLDHLERHLAGRDPLSDEVLARWKYVASSAQR